MTFLRSLCGLETWATGLCASRKNRFHRLSTEGVSCLLPRTGQCRTSRSRVLAMPGSPRAEGRIGKTKRPSGTSHSRWKMTAGPAPRCRPSCRRRGGRSAAETQMRTCPSPKPAALTAEERGPSSMHRWRRVSWEEKPAIWALPSLRRRTTPCTRPPRWPTCAPHS